MEGKIITRKEPDFLTIVATNERIRPCGENLDNRGQAF